MNTPGARELLIVYPIGLGRKKGKAARPAVIATTGCARRQAPCCGNHRTPRPGAARARVRRRNPAPPRPPASSGPRRCSVPPCRGSPLHDLDADWETIAKKLGGQLRNREVADTGEYDTLLVVPAPPDTPKIACLCGSTRYYDQFQQAYYDLTMRGEIVLSVGFYPHSKAKHGHGEGVGHDSARRPASTNCTSGRSTSRTTSSSCPTRPVISGTPPRAEFTTRSSTASRSGSPTPPPRREPAN